MNNLIPLTICMFSNLYPPIHSGSSTQCAQLAAELTRFGCKVIVITSRIDRESADFEVVDGVHIYRIPCLLLPRMSIALNFPWLNVTFTPSNTRRILEILEAHPPDIIHLHNHMFDMAFHATNIARRLNKPFVITIHTIIKHPNWLYNQILAAFDRFLLKHFVIRQADILISPDSIITDYIKQTFGNPGTTLIPYGIHESPSPKLEEMAAIRYRYRLGNGPVILSLGHLHEIRNRKELIEALPQLITHFPKLKVLIVGDVGTDSAEKLASRLGVRNHVIFAGAVPHAEISNFLGIADVEAHWFDRSHPHRSLGIAAQEAMAAGKTVVGNAEENIYGEGVLRNGKNVILVDPSNMKTLVHRITDILMNEKQRKLIGKNAQNTIRKHFSWKAIGSQTLAIYQMIRKSK